MVKIQSHFGINLSKDSFNLNFNHFKKESHKKPKPKNNWMIN